MACVTLALVAACTGVLEGGASPSDGPGDDGEDNRPPRAMGGAGSAGHEETPAELSVRPGASVMRRLNRSQIGFTLFDLLGIESEVVKRFPDDPSAFGFTNNGAALGAGPAMTSLWYEVAAEMSALMVSPGSRAYERVMTCKPVGIDDCARRVLTAFATAAWRRPAEPAEIDDLLVLARTIDESSGAARPLAGLEAAFQGILLSPHFLFHVEVAADEPGVRGLSGRELAARLSYFLWSSVPDAQLLEQADTGALADDTVIRQEVERMLADARGRRLVSALAAEWFRLERLAHHAPDAAVFPTYDAALASDMITETELTLAALLDDDAPLSAIVDGRSSFINQRLAGHYGLATPGDGFVRANLGGDRRGLLTQASVLTATSTADATSPVARGVWVLEHLLCTTPPPVPDNVPIIPDQDKSEKTARQALETHSTDPACASCHKLFDPYGFALEAYDGIGRLRDTDNGRPIDTKVTLIDGAVVDGGAQLGEYLAQSEPFHDCAARKLFAYANGRMPTQDDDDEIARLLADGIPGLKELVLAIATGESFRNKVEVDMPGSLTKDDR